MLSRLDGGEMIVNKNGISSYLNKLETESGDQR